MTQTDIHQLRTDLREIEDRIRPLKETLRSTWTRPMANEQWQLICLRNDATDLYILLAWSRGKYHLADHERCRETAERMAPSYQAEAA